MADKRIVYTILLAAVVIAFAAAYASSHPDGLEWVAEKTGFIESVSDDVIKAPMPDYAISFIKNPYFSTLFAGLVGAVVTGAIFFLVGMFYKKKPN